MEEWRVGHESNSDVQCDEECPGHTASTRYPRVKQRININWYELARASRILNYRGRRKRLGTPADSRSAIRPVHCRFN